mgnify:CR=1 FL=1
MEKFVNKNFHNHNGYLTYTGRDGQRRFVARFKYGGLVAFKKFLRENFSVQEYFDLLATDLAPLQVLHTKGYVSPNARKFLA